MERITTFALRTVMVVLVIAMVSGLVVSIGGVLYQRADTVGFGFRILLGALGVFTLFALLSSIRTRLEGIREVLSKR